MRLIDWRAGQNLTAAECGRRLAMTDANPSKAFQRVESGERIADADMVERIGLLTGGAVSAQDMHETRLAWLKAKRPEKFGEGAASETTPPGRPTAARPSDPLEGEGTALREAAE